MKRNILYSITMAAFLGLSSCASFLEENPKDQMPENEAYKNPQMIYLNTVANLYTMIGGDGGGKGLAGTDRGLYDLNIFTAPHCLFSVREVNVIEGNTVTPPEFLWGLNGAVSNFNIIGIPNS